jgi:hypothetical protein
MEARVDHELLDQDSLASAWLPASDIRGPSSL